MRMLEVERRMDMEMRSLQRGNNIDEYDRRLLREREERTMRMLESRRRMLEMRRLRLSHMRNLSNRTSEQDRVQVISALKLKIPEEGRILGRLKELCRTIEPKYQTAMLKVLGKDAEAIVVDTRARVVQSISYLAERRFPISPSSFLVLDEIQPPPSLESMEHLRTIALPVSERFRFAVDVIRCDNDMVNRAVQKIAGNTLVFDDFMSGKEFMRRFGEDEENVHITIKAAITTNGAVISTMPPTQLFGNIQEDNRARLPTQGDQFRQLEDRFAAMDLAESRRRSAPNDMYRLLFGRGSPRRIAPSSTSARIAAASAAVMDITTNTSSNGLAATSSRVGGADFVGTDNMGSNQVLASGVGISCERQDADPRNVTTSIIASSSDDDLNDLPGLCNRRA